MAQSKFDTAKVSGMVTCVPTLEKCIDDEVELFGGNAKQIARIKKNIGLDRRRVVREGETTADLCEQAARYLLENSQCDVDSIDGLVFVTQTPDYLQPCNAAVMHGKLGLGKGCAALDVNLGCSGYVYGLWLAHMMVTAGGSRRVLLLAGDTISQLVNPRDRSVAPLFGDGGSATLIESVDVPNSAWFSLGTDGKGYRSLIVPAGGARLRPSASTAIESIDEAGNTRSQENLWMNGEDVFKFSIEIEPQAVRSVAEFAGLGFGVVDYFVFHQANKFILKNIAQRLDLGLEKVPMQTVERFGNQSSASIPCALCGELADALRGAEPRLLLLSGFGVGLSWASVILNLSNLSVCEIIDFKS